MRKLFFILLVFSFKYSFAQENPKILKFGTSDSINYRKIERYIKVTSIEFNIGVGIHSRLSRNGLEISYRPPLTKYKYYQVGSAGPHEGYYNGLNILNFHSFLIGYSYRYYNFINQKVFYDIVPFYRLSWKNGASWVEQDYCCTSSGYTTRYSGGGVYMHKYGVKFINGWRFINAPKINCEMYYGVSLFNRTSKITYTRYYNEGNQVTENYTTKRNYFNNRPGLGLHAGITLVF